MTEPLALSGAERRGLPKAVLAPPAVALVLSLLLFAPAGAVHLGIQLLLLAALYELYRLLRLERPWPALALGAGVGGSLLAPDPRAPAAALTLATLLYLGGSIFRRGVEPARLQRETVVAVFGWVYVCWLLGHLALLLRLPQGRAVLLVLVAATTARNVAAGKLGPFVPGHPVSPFNEKKCYEHGVIGLAAAGIAVAAAGALVAGAPPPPHLAAIAVLVGVGGMVGDLVESMLKRTAGVGDSGRALAGLGGVLDVVDSYVYTAPLVFLYLTFAAG